MLFCDCLKSAETTSEEDSEEDKEDEETEKKPKTKTIKETTSEWELLNDVKAIWLRSPKEVTDEEYTKFYHSLAKVSKIIAYDMYFARRHFVFLTVSKFLWCRTLVMKSLCRGAISMLKVMLSSRLFSSFLLKLLKICMRATTTTTKPASNYMSGGFSFLMNLMSFCPSISASCR